MKHPYSPLDFNHPITPQQEQHMLSSMTVIELADGQQEPQGPHLKIWVLDETRTEKQPTRLRLLLPKSTPQHLVLRNLFSLVGHHHNNPYGTVVLTLQHDESWHDPQVRAFFGERFHQVLGLSCQWDRLAFQQASGLTLPTLEALRNQVRAAAENMDFLQFMQSRLDTYLQLGFKGPIETLKRMHLQRRQQKALSGTFLPLREALRVIPRMGLNAEHHTMLAAEVLAVTAWMCNKSVYRFDPAMRKLLHASQFDDQVQAGDFQHPPEFCFVIQKTPLYLGPNAFVGSLVYFSPHPETGLPHIHIHIMQKSEQMCLFSTHFIPLQGDLQSILQQEGERQGRVLQDEYGVADIPQPVLDMQAQFVRECLMEVLYLCSARPDCSLPENPLPKVVNVLGKPKIQVNTEVEWKQVGVRIGAAFRKSETFKEPEQRNMPSPTGTVRVPHPRVSHFRRSRVGSRTAPEVKHVLHWIPPVVVNMHLLEDKADLPVTIRPVEPQQPS